MEEFKANGFNVKQGPPPPPQPQQPQPPQPPPQQPQPQQQQPRQQEQQPPPTCEDLLKILKEPRYSLTREEHDRNIFGLLRNSKKTKVEEQVEEQDEKQVEEQDESDIPQNFKNDLDKTSWIKNIPSDISTTKKVIYDIVKNMIKDGLNTEGGLNDIKKGSILIQLKDSRTVNSFLDKTLTSEQKDKIKNYLNTLT